MLWCLRLDRSDFALHIVQTALVLTIAAKIKNITDNRVLEHNIMVVEENSGCGIARAVMASEPYRQQTTQKSERPQ